MEKMTNEQDEAAASNTIEEKQSLDTCQVFDDIPSQNWIKKI